MNRYRQLTSGERYALSALRKQGCSQAAIARALGRHRSTISREVRRNSKDRGGRAYRPDLADDYARWRRGRSRRNERFGASDWRMVEACLRQQWSPEQAAGWLRRKDVALDLLEGVLRLLEKRNKQSLLLLALYTTVPPSLNGEGSQYAAHDDYRLKCQSAARRNLSTTMGHSTGLIKEQFPVWRGVWWED